MNVLLELGGAVLLPLLVLLETSPTPVEFDPPASSGFAYATVLGGIFGVGLLCLLWFLLNLKPKRRQPYRGPND